jgi:hypothetical protein
VLRVKLALTASTKAARPVQSATRISAGSANSAAKKSKIGDPSAPELLQRAIRAPFGRGHWPVAQASTVFPATERNAAIVDVSSSFGWPNAKRREEDGRLHDSARLPITSSPPLGRFNMGARRSW